MALDAQGAMLRVTAAVNAIVTKARQLHDGIPDVVVVVGASGVTRSGQAHGHFAPKSWTVRGEEDKDRELYGEIFLAGESLSRGAVGTLGTILHELAHAYNFANDINDTSNGNRYHNAKFQAKGIEFGLELEKVDVIGWSKTTVPQSTIDTYSAEVAALEEAIDFHRLGYSDLAALGIEDEKKKPKKRFMQCPDCEVPLMVTKKWWEQQGSGGGEYLMGMGIMCKTHGTDYEIYEEGGEE